MAEIIATLIFLVLCGVVPVALVLGFILWQKRRQQRREQPAARSPERRELLAELDALLEHWTAQQKLSPETGAQVRALIEQERAALTGQQPAPQQQVPALPLPAMEAPEATTPPAEAPVSPVSTPSTAVPPLAAGSGGAADSGSFWDALLAMRTRMTVLFLGAFLLLISSLILVIYNWASFPPILQFGLLVAVCGGFWAGGTWVSKQPELEKAGVGLQAVGGVLVPVVGFALSRPGLLPFPVPVRMAWLLASGVSLAVYVLASWRLRHILFVVAGCLAGISTTLAVLYAAHIAAGWWGAVLVLVLAAYLPLARWLHQHAMPDLALVPLVTAHVSVGVTVVLALALASTQLLDSGHLAATCWAGVAFYALATWLDQRPRWLWGAAGLVPLALLASLDALAIGLEWWGLALALLALAYLGLSAALEPRAQPYTLPGYVGAVVLVLLALSALPNSWRASEWAVRLALLVLLVAGVGATLIYHRGRLAWLAEPRRLGVAAGGLTLVGVLLPLWLQTLLDLVHLESAEQGVALLPLAGVYAVAAYRWPGQVRRWYDLTLQALTALLGLYAGMLTLLDSDTRVPGMLLLTAVWVLQTVLRRWSFWAVLAAGNALLAAFFHLIQSETADTATWAWYGLTFTVVYLVGATLVRRTAWRCWTWPGIGWGVLVGSLTLLIILSDTVEVGQVVVYHALQIGLLVALAVALTWLWRQPWIGYPAAALLSLLVLLAASEGFFTPWQPAFADVAYVLCGLTLALFLLGQGIRRRAARYAYPYELVGYALLTLAPLPAAPNAAHATLTWGAMALLYGLAAWRYRLAWMLAPALLAGDMALLRGVGWQFPGGDPAGAGVVLLVAAWTQGLAGLVAHRYERQQAGRHLLQQHYTAAYAVTLLSGTGALLLASSSSSTLATVFLGLAALAALVATLERCEPVAWGALLLLGGGVFSLEYTLDIEPLWMLAWGVPGALLLSLTGWGVERLTHHDTWRRPLLYGPLAAGGGLVLVLLLFAPASDNLPPLTSGLANLGLLTATLAVRQRTIEYAYVAGAALMGAGMSQLYDWEVSQLQWYVVPAGLYLLALAEGLRRFQGQRRVSQVIEVGALMLFPGATLGQSLRAEGSESLLYAMLVCFEALLVLGYGTLRKLRVPFLGGAVFFVLGVLWMSVDPLRAANKWVLLGVLGIVLVGVYVLLERKQEQLARASRAWVERLQSWG